MARVLLTFSVTGPLETVLPVGLFLASIVHQQVNVFINYYVSDIPLYLRF